MTVLFSLRITEDQFVVALGHKIHSANPPVVIGICDPNKSQA